MNPKINYTLVGAFVVFFVVTGLGLAVWMGHERGAVERLPYVTYFYDSVSGLNERAQVKYRGVPIGQVESIRLVNDPHERVQLRLLLNAEVPIRTDTFATLQFQGITGLLFVELQSVQAQGVLLETSAEHPAEIPSRASRLVQFTESLDDLSHQLASLLLSFHQVSNQLADLTDPEMRQQLLDLMQAGQQLALTAEDRLQKINPRTYEQLASRLEGLAKEMGQRASELPEHLQRLEVTLEQQLQAAQDQLRQLAQDASSSGRQLMPLLQQSEQLLEQLRREGASWLRGHQLQAPGPGE